MLCRIQTIGSWVFKFASVIAICMVYGVLKPFQDTSHSLGDISLLLDGVLDHVSRFFSGISQRIMALKLKPELLGHSFCVLGLVFSHQTTFVTVTLLSQEPMCSILMALKMGYYYNLARRTMEIIPPEGRRRP